MTFLLSKPLLSDMSDLALLTMSGQIMSQLPGVAFVKSSDSIYVATNQYCAHLYGFKKADQVSGLNDHELKSSVVECAEEFRKEDKKVIFSGFTYKFIHINYPLQGKRHIFLSHKIPIKNFQGIIIGLNCIANEITNPFIEKGILNLLNLNKHFKSSKTKGKFHIKIDDYHIFPKLDSFESEILYLLNIGLTVQQVGFMTHLSPGCVESYIELIKFRLRCDSYQELLQLCHAKNFHTVIPQCVLDKVMSSCAFATIKPSVLDDLSILFDSHRARGISFEERLLPNKQHIFRDKNTGALLDLSPQQQQCLHYLFEGKSAKEIAQEMHLSYRTVEHYLSTIRRKTGYSSIKQLLTNVIF